jgi:hypothetical protein
MIEGSQNFQPLLARTPLQGSGGGFVYTLMYDQTGNYVATLINTQTGKWVGNLISPETMADDGDAPRFVQIAAMQASGQYQGQDIELVILTCSEK